MLSTAVLKDLLVTSKKEKIQYYFGHRQIKAVEKMLHKLMQIKEKKVTGL